MEMETRTALVRAVDEKARRVTFVASSEAIDSYDSVIRQNWRLDRWNANPVVLFAHNQRDLPIGKGVGLKVVKKETLIEVEFASAELNPLADQVFRLVAAEFLRGCSIGFYPHKVSYEEIDNRDVVVLDDNELLELSITPIPANPDALAKLRSRALATLAPGRVVRPGDIVALNLATDPPSPKSPAERGEQQENRMTLEEQNAALTKKVAEREAEVRVAEKGLADIRAERDVLATQNKALVVERDGFKDRAEKAESTIVEREVDALVGVKISAAEKPTYLKLARSNPDLFKEMVEQRSPLGGGTGLLDEKGQSRSVLGDDVEGAKRAPVTGGDGDNSSALAKFNARRRAAS
jgi:HK97 family phage prohead protease